MADNFDLRQFLTENKLTKNAKLLAENTDISQTFSNEEITGEVTVATIPSLGEDPKFEVMDAKKALAMIKNEAEGAEKVTVYPGSKIDRQGDYNKETKELKGKLGVMIFSKSGNKAYEIYQGSNNLNEGKFSDSYKSQAAKDASVEIRNQIVNNLESTKYEDLKGIVDDAIQATGGEVSPVEKAALLKHANWILTYNFNMQFEGVEEAKIPKENSKKVSQIEVGDILSSGEEVTEKTKEDGGMIKLTLTKKLPNLKIKERTQSYSPGNTMFMQKEKITGKELEKTKETVKENTMTTRERRLVEMVQKAMKENSGLKTYKYTGGGENSNKHGHEIERAQQSIGAGIDPKIEDGGGEMAKETVIPEYNTIEELMKEIEEGTNKVAETYKISEMKKIAEALRKRKYSLEESEHAQYISKSDLIKLGKEITAIDKAVTKLEISFDKKFNKKTKSTAAPKAEKEETPTLKENTMKNTFDLKKFLVENKLTRNSRLLKENVDMGEKMQFFMDFMEQYQAGMPEADILEILEDSYNIPENVDMQILEKATEQLDLAINDIYTAIFESENY